MWLGRFLDLTEDIPQKIRNKLSKHLEHKKLTPLEFTILENIFNSKRVSGYDLIYNLNKHFAGTWKAHSGTIYPILSKLKRKGFLDSEEKKSPLGPKVKLYFLTKAGEEIIKTKVNKNFLDQLKFIENFLIELSSIYIQSFPVEQKEKVTTEVQNILRNTLETIGNAIPLNATRKIRCPNCNIEIDRGDSRFCSNCGADLRNYTQ
ncbi:MAG TPA: helix-turn-helix transcriptional regulator [Candidatus Deferrimicrobium sp.]|nr:helix-turn-helix transcriptional regulator [Candidatus Deferrimicrobium sp.]